MQKYMRDQFEYLGIKSPEAKALLRRNVQDASMQFDGLNANVRSPKIGV